MACENIYANETENIYANETEDIYANETGPKVDETFYKEAPSPHPKKPISSSSSSSTTLLLTILAVLLAVSLLAVSILYFQRQKQLHELEGKVEEVRTALQLSNFSYASGNESESSPLTKAQLLENIILTCAETQAHLENVSASEAAAQDNYRSALSKVQLLENITQTCSETQARLEYTSASEAAAQNRYRDLLRVVSSGWKHHGGGFYFFSKETKSWQEAEQACASYGAHLTSVTSRQEMEYLTGETNGEAFYIGLTDQWQEGNWTWVDGTKYNSQVSFWARGQPDNWHGAPGMREDCVHIRSKDLNAWNDISCTLKFKYICKRIFS